MGLILEWHTAHSCLTLDTPCTLVMHAGYTQLIQELYAGPSNVCLTV